MNALEVRQLTKSFGNFAAVRELDLTVRDGELFGFLGKNGAGKSTFINIVTGLIHKTSGSFQVYQYRDDEMDRIKKIIGVMPDTTNLYHSLSAIDFVRYMSELKGRPLSRAEGAELLDKVGLSGHENKKIKKFSFGMRKKISLAQAIAGKPKLLFLDEPTSGLDPQSTLEIQQLIRDLNRDGVTVFMTSHNLHEVEKMCDRIAIMSKGKVVKAGSLEELREEAQSRVEVRIRHQPVNPQWQEEDFAPASILSCKEDEMVLEVEKRDQIADIVELLVSRNVRILAVSPVEYSLEQIFMEQL